MNSMISKELANWKNDPENIIIEAANPAETYDTA